MPFGGKPMAEADIELFRRWIREGARNDGGSPEAVTAERTAVVYKSAPLLTAFALSPDGRTVAVSGYREVLLTDREGKLLARLPGLSPRIHSIAFTSDGATLIAVGGEPARFGEVQIWDVASRTQRHSSMVSTDTLFGASLSPDDKLVACGAADKAVRIFDVATGKEIRRIDHHEDWVFGTVFGVDGKRLVTVGRDRAAKITDVGTGRFVENVNLLKEALSAVARHPKKDWVAIGGAERVPYLYMMDRPRAMRIADDSTLIRKFERQDGPILALAISSDGGKVAVASEVGDVRIYDAETGDLVARCGGHEGGTYAVTFTPDGRELAAGGFDGVLRFYDLTGETGAVVRGGSGGGGGAMRIAGLLILLAAGLNAAPVIREIEPRGAQRGKAFQLVLKGSDLPFGAKVETALPANVSRMAPAKEGQLPFLVELKKDAPVGLYPLRLVTNDGLSNVVLFSVGELPETVEIESESDDPKKENGAIEKAEKLTTPGVVTGTLTAADVDYYAVTVKAGERLVLETEAAAAGSAVDTALEIVDAAEKVLAKNDDAAGAGSDARIEHTFVKGGTYYVRVHDSKYSDQAVNFYRLKAGAYPFAEALFPLGGQRGKPVEVELVGGSLAQAVTVKPDTSGARRYVPLHTPGSASLPLLFVLGDGPEAMEAAGAALEPAVVMNGRVANKGEVDKYKLAVAPGQHWVIEVQASSLGTSQLDALVTVYGPDGKKIASRDDLGSADPVVPFEVPKDVNEVTVAVEDLLGRGGPAFGYRLKAERGPADFIVQLATPFVNVPAGGTMILPVTVQRRGHDGAVRLRIVDLPAGLRQAGGHVPPAAAQQRFDDPNPRFSATRSTITITADDDAPAAHWRLKVVGIAETAQGRIVREAEGPGLITGVRGTRAKAVTAPWLEMALPIAVAKRLPVRITTPVALARLAQGVEFEMKYKIERGPNARTINRVRETTASAIGNLRILQGPPAKVPDTGSLMLNTNFATPATTFDMYLQVTAEVDGQRMDVYTPMITIDVVEGYQVRPERTQYALAAGGKMEISGAVHREPTFEGGLVKLEVQDLPDGVKCGAAEVTADVRAWRVACEAGTLAKAGEYDVRLASTAPDTGRKAPDTYKATDLPLKLKIEGAARAGR